MIQFAIAGETGREEVRLFESYPCLIGRSQAAHLRLERSGVWDRHCEVQFDPAEGFVLSAFPDALTAVNGKRVQKTVLRNGDLIEMGSVKLRFWLSETRQRGLKAREALTWIFLAGITLAEGILIYRLLQL